MDRSQVEDMLGGPVSFGRPRRLPGIWRTWRPFEQYLWCATCTRAFPNGVYRQVGKAKRCPYAGCCGNANSTALDWSVLKRQWPNYPATPWMSVQYSRDRPVPSFGEER